MEQRERDRPPRVALETHGCKLNQADSEALARQLARAGFQVVSPQEEAEVYILNTCTVTGTADRKARQALRSARRRLPGAFLVATGCYAQRAPQEVSRLPGVDLVVGNAGKGALVERLLQALGGSPVPCSTGEERPGPALPGRTRAFLKIQEGCNQVCAYCIVPRVRGRERSIPPEALVAEVRARLAEGYQEVVLTGTQLGTYGYDLPGASLERLLRRLLAETPIPRLRVSSLQPQEVTPSLLSLWREDPRLCPHFHLPLQSGSDAVLQRMRRRYTTDLYRRTVEAIRSLLPQASVTADVIVGFPGETEEDFQATCRFCAEVGFTALHVFPYSPRPGTSAARLPHQVDERTKARRTRELLALARDLARRARQGAIGQCRPVLWEEARSLDGLTLWTGLTDTYLRVWTVSPRPLGNRITPARITGEQGEALWAVPLL